MAATGTATVVSPTGLFWAETGEVTCPSHHPYPGSDTWVWGRWSPMAAADVAEWTSYVGSEPRCEVCGATATKEATNG